MHVCTSSMTICICRERERGHDITSVQKRSNPLVHSRLVQEKPGAAPPSVGQFQLPLSLGSLGSWGRSWVETVWGERFGFLGGLGLSAGVWVPGRVWDSRTLTHWSRNTSHSHNPKDSQNYISRQCTPSYEASKHETQKRRN